MTTAYAPPYGTGDRRSRITVTTDATLVTGSFAGLLDGNVATNVGRFSSGQSGRHLTFDFGAPAIVDEATWYQSATNAHGTWQWQGSADGAAWTDLGAAFMLGGAATQVQTALHGNTSAYRYYRLQQTAGTANATPYLREIEFRAHVPLIASITAPLEMAVLRPATPITLSATATDQDGAPVAGATFAWTSDRDGALGTGAERAVTLSEGRHTLSVAVTDGDGNTAGASVTVLVAAQRATYTTHFEHGIVDLSPALGWSGAGGATGLVPRVGGEYLEGTAARWADSGDFFWLVPGDELHDFDVTVRFIPVRITAHYYNASLGFHRAGVSQMVSLFARAGDDGQVWWYQAGVVYGTVRFPGFVGGVAGLPEWVRLRAEGKTLRIKRWHGARADEPAGWAWLSREPGQSGHDVPEGTGGFFRISSGSNHLQAITDYDFIELTDLGFNQRPSAPTLSVSDITRTSAVIHRIPGEDPEGDPIVATRLQIATTVDFSAGLVYDSGAAGEAPFTQKALAGLLPGVAYHYRGADADAGGLGAWSPTSSFTTAGAPVPTVTVATTLCDPLVVLSATEDPPAPAGTLYDWELRAEGSGAEWQRLATAAASPYGAPKPASGTYRYRAARTGGVDWGESAPVVIADPAPLIALRTTSGSDAVRVVVTPPPGAAGSTYLIDTAPSADGPWTLAASGTQTEYDLGPLPLGTWVRARALHAAGCTATAVAAQVMPAPAQVVPHAQWEVLEWQTIRIPWP